MDADQRYLCRICGFNPLVGAAMDSHYKDQHKKHKKHRCNECLNRCKTKPDFENHRGSCRPPVNPAAAQGGPAAAQGGVPANAGNAAAAP